MRSTDVVYAVAFVAIFGGLIGFQAVSKRMEPAEVTRIHNEMEAERDAYLPTFRQMAFELEVLSKELNYTKYPLPDERYYLEVNALGEPTLAEGQASKGIFYDFTSDPKLYIVSIPGGKRIKKGDKLVKEVGNEYFLVKHPEVVADTLELHWRLFFPQEIKE